MHCVEQQVPSGKQLKHADHLTVACKSVQG